MDSKTLNTILLEEIQQYAGKGLNAESLLTQNEEKHIYAVIDYADIHGKQFVSTVLVARIVDDKVIVDIDHNNKPLFEALRSRGVPEQQIVLAYLPDESTA